MLVAVVVRKMPSLEEDFEAEGAPSEAGAAADVAAALAALPERPLVVRAAPGTLPKNLHTRRGVDRALES